MIQIPENIRSITPYSPGKPIEELERELGITGSIKLASNENPLGPSPKAVEAIKGALGGLNRYPDGSGFYLRQAIAKKFGLDSAQVFLGNGSNEIIEIAIRTFVQPGDEVISASPSFVVYPMITQAAAGVNVVVPLKDNRHDLDAMAAKVTPKTRIVFIANPNNPTGTMNTAAEMERFMGRVPDHVIVCVDEAYFEYVTRTDYPNSLSILKSGKNMLLLRTFSKIYGLAGLRIGYGLTTPEISGAMNRVRQPFNTNSLAQIAALAALSDTGHVENTREVNEQGKKFLYHAFDRLKLSHMPTEANFILFEAPQEGNVIYEALLTKGVIVRPMGGKKLRVTIGLPEENERFVRELEMVLTA